MSDHDADYAIALPFDTDDPQFRRGVEIGVLWQRIFSWRRIRNLAAELCGEPSPVHLSATLHGDCAEMVIRIAETCDLDWTCKAIDDDWMLVTLEPQAAEQDGDDDA